MKLQKKGSEIRVRYKAENFLDISTTHSCPASTLLRGRS